MKSKVTSSKILALLLTLAMLLSMMITTATASTNGYSDIPTDWRKGPIEYAIANGLLVGNEGKVDPDGYVTRAMMATIITKAFGATEFADISSFTDVPTTAWYCGYISKAYKMKILLGGNNLMTPENNITREQAFTVLAKALKLSTSDYSSLNRFTDKNKINNMYKSYVAALAEANLINGSNGILNPTDYITRAQFAAVMQNIVKSYIGTAGTYTTVTEGSLLIKVPNVTLKDVTVSGDLIIGDGVGTGNITLDNVKVTGRTVIRGGGKNSIEVINGSELIGSVIVDNVNNEIRIVTDEGTTIQKIEVGSQVILDGQYGDITVIGDSTTSIVLNGQAQNMIIQAPGASVTVAGTVQTVSTTPTAAGAKITVSAGGTINTVVAAGEGTIIDGEGTVSVVEVMANNCAINTAGTIVQVANNVTGTTAGGEPVQSGSSTQTPGGTPPSPPSPPSPSEPPTPPAIDPITSVQLVMADDTYITSSKVQSNYIIDISDINSGVIEGIKINSTPVTVKLKVDGQDEVVVSNDNGTFMFGGYNGLIKIWTGVDIQGDISISTIKSVFDGSFSGKVKAYDSSYNFIQEFTLTLVVSDSSSLSDAIKKVLESFDLEQDASTRTITAKIKSGHKTDKIFTQTGFYALLKAMVTIPDGYTYGGVSINGGAYNTDELDIMNALKAEVGKSIGDIMLQDLNGFSIKIKALDSSSEAIITTVNITI
jgi:hypothetical protein